MKKLLLAVFLVLSAFLLLQRAESVSVAKRSGNYDESLPSNEYDDQQSEINDDVMKRAIMKRVYHFRIPFRGRARKEGNGPPGYVRKYRYRFLRDSHGESGDEDDDLSGYRNWSQDDNDSRDDDSSPRDKKMGGSNRFDGEDEFENWRKKRSFAQNRFPDEDFEKKKKSSA